MQRLKINPDFSECLSSVGLESLGSFFANPPRGDIVEDHGNRTVQRIEISGTRFYLKRVHRVHPLKSFEALARLRLPHHYCWREMQQLTLLREAGFSVPVVAAAGEKLRMAVPVESFILTKEVVGLSLDKLLERSAFPQQLELVKELGVHTARLHLAGFFTPLRQKDIICGESGKHWTLIDRETRFPGRQPFSEGRALKALVRTFRREGRNISGWNEPLVTSYLAGYRETIGDCWSLDEDLFIKLCAVARSTESE